MESVEALVEAGADVNIAAEGGVTALHAAAELGNLPLVQLLLKVLPALTFAPFPAAIWAGLAWAAALCSVQLCGDLWALTAVVKGYRQDEGVWLKCQQGKARPIGGTCSCGTCSYGPFRCCYTHIHVRCCFSDD